MNGMSGDSTDWHPENTPTDLISKGAAVLSAARNHASDGSPLTTATPAGKSEGFSATSATPRLEPSSSTRQRQPELSPIYRVSHSTMKCILHWWNPALFVKGHLCLMETYPSDVAS